jgi:hypothetical protein
MEAAQERREAACACKAEVSPRDHCRCTFGDQQATIGNPGRMCPRRPGFWSLQRRCPTRANPSARYRMVNRYCLGATPVGLSWVWARGFVAAERPKEEPSQRPNCAGTFSSGLLGGLLVACVPRWRRKDATALQSYSSLACSWYRSQNAPSVRSLPRALKTVHVYPSHIFLEVQQANAGTPILVPV